MSQPATSGIRAQEVRFSYPPAHPDLSAQPVFSGLSLQVPAGEALAVLGGSGSGKSTLCYLLAGLAPRYTGGQASGNIWVAGNQLLGGSQGAPPPVGAVGVLFQDAATQLFTTTVEDEIAWGLEALGRPAVEITCRVAEALHAFDLVALRHRSPWTLSGGEQKRLALAAVWAMRPRVLLLDEPLNGLDPRGRREVRAALQSLGAWAADGLPADGLGTTQILTTYRPETARLAAQATLLSAGQAQPPLPTDDLLAQECLVAAGVLYPPERWPDLPPAPAVATGEAAVVAQGLSYHYPDGPPVLHDLHFTIPEGQFVAIVGPNGAGKSTLIRHFNGLVRASQGQVRICGQAVGARPTGELARQVGFLFQRPEQQLFAGTVRAEVAYGVRQLRLPEPERRVAAALARFDLQAVADLPPSVLGYGEQRAVTLAVLSALETRILVLDEPLVGLDGRRQRQLLTWLAHARTTGVTLVVVTHEMGLARRADRVIYLEAGRIAADGPPAEVLPLFATAMEAR